MILKNCYESYKINDMEDFLVKEEKRVLREAHRAERVKKKADRIKTILLLNEGWSYEQIAQALFLDDSTVRRYQTEYQAGGLDGLLDDNYILEAPANLRKSNSAF